MGFGRHYVCQDANTRRLVWSHTRLHRFLKTCPMD